MFTYPINKPLDESIIKSPHWILDYFSDPMKIFEQHKIGWVDHQLLMAANATHHQPSELPGIKGLHEDLDNAGIEYDKTKTAHSDDGYAFYCTLSMKIKLDKLIKPGLDRLQSTQIRKVIGQLKNMETIIKLEGSAALSYGEWSAHAPAPKDLLEQKNILSKLNLKIFSILLNAKSDDYCLNDMLYAFKTTKIPLKYIKFCAAMQKLIASAKKIPGEKTVPDRLIRAVPRK